MPVYRIKARQPIILRPSAAPPAAAPSIARPFPLIVRVEEWPSQPGQAIILRPSAAPTVVAPIVRQPIPLVVRAEDWPPQAGQAIILRPLAAPTVVAPVLVRPAPLIVRAEGWPPESGQALILRGRPGVPAPSVRRPVPLIAQVEEWPPREGLALILRPLAAPPVPTPSVRRPIPLIVRVEELAPFPGSVLALGRRRDAIGPQIYNLAVSVTLNVSAAIPLHLGRYRWGDIVEVSFAAIERPLGIPIARVTDQANLEYLAPVLWSWDGGESFHVEIIPDMRMAAGTFDVKWVLSADLGRTYLLWQQFDVVLGGDQEGHILALYAHEGVQGRRVLAQTRTGKLIMGHDPSL